MKHVDTLVIGGSAAGLTAAITARRHYPEKNVLLIRKEEQVLIPCGIPYIFGTVGSPENNLIPDTALTQNKIDLLIDEVRGLDRAKGEVNTSRGETIAYDRLILATGSLPAMPPIPGFELGNVFPVHKDVAHLRNMQNALKGVSDLVIIGGGFIGVEFADECKKCTGANVSIVEMLPHCLILAYDDEFCIHAEELLQERGVIPMTNTKVKRLVGKNTVEGVELENGITVPAQTVIVGIGAAANVVLAERAGLNIGPTGGIAVDRTMRTSDDRIYACGDCAEKVSFFGGRPSGLKLASIATAEARIAAANLFGTRRESIGTVGVWSTAIGETAFATAGLTETLATRHGYNYVVGTAEAVNRHPGGMPGARKMKVKLVFEKRTGVLLGGQVMGDSAAGEVINAISACVQRRMTAEDVAMFQTGTHPALTASPIAYQFVNAAEAAIAALR
ncbi:MAG TPA: FAD-dependent oxidoreductase [Candidatus Hydrogenedentes bacterium]|nr:FAD-dependent oxidoreductase [Candidatus Hydrogenedentota bacterium]HPG68849.1 FAD-dependent oxidoreductase [Candidatus Hydrogenedentota bacterium]